MTSKPSKQDRRMASTRRMKRVERLLDKQRRPRTPAMRALGERALALSAAQYPCSECGGRRLSQETPAAYEATSPTMTENERGAYVVIAAVDE